MVKWNGILPLGSVVLLNGADKRFQIIGQIQADPVTMKIYDYAAVPIPEGYLDEDTLAMFQHEDIRLICAIGHLDDKVWDMLDYFRQLRKNLRDGKITVQEILETRGGMENPQAEADSAGSGRAGAEADSGKETAADSNVKTDASEGQKSKEVEEALEDFFELADAIGSSIPGEEDDTDILPNLPNPGSPAQTSAPEQSGGSAAPGLSENLWDSPVSAQPSVTDGPAIQDQDQPAGDAVPDDAGDSGERSTL